MIPWRREWQSTPVFLPGEYHGRRSLASYSPWGSQRVWHDWVSNTFCFPDLLLYLFIFDCAGSLLLLKSSLQSQRAGAALWCGAQASHYRDFSYCGAQPLGHAGFSSCDTGLVVVVNGLSCSKAYGIFPEQGSNSCPLRWQADSYPLRHQGSPLIFKTTFIYLSGCIGS